MSVKTIIIIAVIHIISGNISKAVVKSKNYPDSINHGFAWGFFLGILGLISVFLKHQFPNEDHRLLQVLVIIAETLQNPGILQETATIDKQIPEP